LCLKEEEEEESDTVSKYERKEHCSSNLSYEGKNRRGRALSTNNFRKGNGEKQNDVREI
jgi:hypothetical protein